MFIESERKLIKKNYEVYQDNKNIVYISKDNKSKKISIENLIDHNFQPTWKVTFPLRNSNTSYYTFFDSKHKAKSYLQNIINTYL